MLEEEFASKLGIKMFRVLVLVGRITLVLGKAHIVVLNERRVDPAGEHSVLGGFLLVKEDEFHIAAKLNVLVPTRNVTACEALLLERHQFPLGGRKVIVNYIVVRISSDTDEERLASTIDVELGHRGESNVLQRQQDSVHQDRSIHPQVVLEIPFEVSNIADLARLHDTLCIQGSFSGKQQQGILRSCDGFRVQKVCGDEHSGASLSDFAMHGHRSCAG